MKEILNNTELRVVKYICRQLTAKEIAGKMGLKFRTVETYRASIQKKVKAKNVVGIVLWAIRNGVVKA